MLLVKIQKIYCNNANAGIILKAKKLGLECRIFTKQQWSDGTISTELKGDRTNFIVLAGFLWLVPSQIISFYKNRIINIHPALLPKYGGKGMYGQKVHESIIANNETESGITIHLVNEEYDKGEIILQKKIALTQNQTPLSLAAKIHELEYECYPQAVEKYIDECIKKGQ